MVLTPGNAFAETGYISDDITYTIEGGTMTISGSGDMPDYEGSNNRPYNEQAGNITEVVIGDGVTSIGESAFSNCTSLRSIEIPDSVQSIGGGAFYECTNLTSIKIPDSVTAIGEDAFDRCTSLRSIEIPGRVGAIGEWTFYKCTSLDSVTIQDGVRAIGKEAFRECMSLTSVEIPGSVTSIGESAFFVCTSLASIEIPGSVASISDHAFDKCASLTSVKISEGVASIGISSFYGCTSLTSIEIPESVTSIGDGAFWKCTSLTSIEIPESVASIGYLAFWDCTSLTSVTISSSDTSIGDEVFTGCTALETLIVPEGLKLCENPGLDITQITQITYTVNENKEVTITRVTLGQDKDKVTIGDTVNGMDVVGVAEDFRSLVSDEGHEHKGGTANCTQKAKCAICGEEYGDFKHEKKSIPAVPATCTTAGTTAGEKCSVCGQVLVAPEPIPATGHSYENGKCTACGAADPDYRQPGETTHTHSAQGGWQYDSGSHWKTCGCGEVLERENHDLAWVIDRKPTEETEGLRHKECSVCGYARAEVSIPALGSDADEDAAMREDDALPEEPAETEETGSDAGEYTDNPGTGGASPVHALLLAAGALGALLWLRKRRG